MSGIEVPIIEIDNLNWFEVSVPAVISHVPSDNFAPATKDIASCFIIEDPSTCVIWRIHKRVPHVLELLELSSSNEYPRVGLRIVFRDALCPFAFICKSETEHPSGKPYLLYALTVSGVAYAFKLQRISAYASYTVFPLGEFAEFNLQTYSNCGRITSVAAILGCFVTGRSDGSVYCFQLGRINQNAPGFVHELRDDSGIGRLWGLMSRNRNVEPVQDLSISEFQGKKFLFVLHFNGILRVWDLLDHNKVFSQTVSTAMLEGCVFDRLWVGDIDYDTYIIPLAILYRGTLEASTISRYTFRFCMADRIIFSLEPSMQNIPLEQGELIDVNLTSSRLLLLTESGLTSYNLLHRNQAMEGAHMYALQESNVADQLFQSSEHSADDLLWISHTMFCSVKDQTASFISSIFLRRLLSPGINHKIVMRATFEEFNKHWTDSEFQSLTVDGLKKEILLLMEHESFRGSSTSIFYRWKKFCKHYFENWCKHNAPYGFLADPSTGAIGLIRRNSISLFRVLEDIELLHYGSADGHCDFVTSALNLSDLECEILFKVLDCTNSISHQLGKAGSAIFYESLVSMPSLSSEDVISCFLKVLETGCASSALEFHVSDVGLDSAWEKGLSEHKNLRKFSVDMALSLHSLCNNATTWEKVLNVIQEYVKLLVPHKITQNLDAEVNLSIKTSILVQATSQVAELMFESAISILLFLSYLVAVSGQIDLCLDDIIRIQRKLVPRIEEIVIEWLIIHFFGITTCESLAIEDFSSQLSYLQIDSSSDKTSWKEWLGKCDFTIAFILLLNSGISCDEQIFLSLRGLPNSDNFTTSIRGFVSWIIWGATGEESSAFFSHVNDIVAIMLKNGQYDAVEIVLGIVDAHLMKEKVSECIQSINGEWCTRLHLLGCCFLAQAHYRLQGTFRERKLCEAVRCFFRASCGQGASKALQKLSYETGLPPIDEFSGPISVAAWKFYYYQWTMQIFEQFSFNEGACQFALAALEQVDESFVMTNDSSGRDLFYEPSTTVKGRLWANVFKFSLDLDHYNDAYCAIISNPDEESKYICLRRFIIVLYERGATKFLYGGKVPFIGLTEQAERELIWKAERSDISAKPSPYKLLYAFEMHKHNWRKAASYLYQYASHLKTEAALKDYQHRSLVLQERLDGLSAAINALHLLHPAYAWIETLNEGSSLENEHYLSKKSKKSVEQCAGNGIRLQRLQSYVDVEKLEKEYVLTSAEYLLSLANVKWTFDGIQNVPSDLIELLAQMNFYDMIFVVLLKFWKDSRLRRELEKVFIAMSLKCCPNGVYTSLVRNDFNVNDLSLTSSKRVVSIRNSLNVGSTQQSRGNSQWETLELYLEKYKRFHPTLPVIVAEALLSTNPDIELPLWLVNMMKAGRGENICGMVGKESNPASLFRVYVDYGRYAEATNLLLEYIERYSSKRPSHRKKPFAACFPYTAIERIWCKLEELINSGHMVDHCDNLKRLLQGALTRHLQLVKMDSEDVLNAS